MSCIQINVFNFVLQLKEVLQSCSGCSTWSRMTHLIMSGQLTASMHFQLANTHMHPFNTHSRYTLHSLSHCSYNDLAFFSCFVYNFVLYNSNSVKHIYYILHEHEDYNWPVDCSCCVPQDLEHFYSV